MLYFYFVVSDGTHTKFIYVYNLSFTSGLNIGVIVQKLLLQFKSTEEPRGQERYVINRWNVVSSSTFSIRLITNTECYKRIACIQSLIVVYEHEFDKSETADLDHVLY